MSKPVNISAVILGAGKSSRMGIPKPFLRYNQNSLFIEQIARVYYTFGCKKIVIVLNVEANNPLLLEQIDLPPNTLLTFIKNSENGRFHSLRSGIQQLNNPDYCFFQNIDNPFVSNILLETLSKHICDEAEVLFPHYFNKGGHPALLSSKVIKAILAAEDKDQNIKDFLKKFPGKTVEFNNPNILANVNTLEDYDKYFNEKISGTLA